MEIPFTIEILKSGIWQAHNPGREATPNCLLKNIQDLNLCKEKRIIRVALLNADGVIETLYGGTTPAYMINKFSWQDGIAALSSPVYLRLAEMYLNRAEANAKLSNFQEAIDDV